MCRLFAGIGGAACITLGAGVIADLFPIEMRGRASSIWSMGPLIGPVVGPIAGGFLGEEVSWRWVFWVLLIAGGSLQLGIEILNRETYAPVLIRWKKEKLAKELGRTDLVSVYDVGREPLSNTQILKRSLVRPALLFCKSPIVLLLSTYMVRLLTSWLDICLLFIDHHQHSLTPKISLLSTAYYISSSRPSPVFSPVPITSQLAYPALRT